MRANSWRTWAKNRKDARGNCSIGRERQPLCFCNRSNYCFIPCLNTAWLHQAMAEDSTIRPRGDFDFGGCIVRNWLSDDEVWLD